MVAPISHIEPHEEAEAIAAINEGFIEMTGKPFTLRPAGYNLALRIHVIDDHIKTASGAKLFLPETMRDERKYTSAVALVCAIGPDAYRDKERYPFGPWCKVGDWVAFNRYEGNAFSYRGVPMVLLPDDRIICVIDNPDEISSINSASKL